MDNMKKIFLPLSIMILSLTTSAYAARIEVDAPRQVSNSFSVGITADTEGASVNAVDVVVTYPKELMDFNGFKKNAGVVTLWITPPTEISPGTIVFSGVIPGGVDRGYDPQYPADGHIILTQLLFTPTYAGSGEIVVTDASLLRNDGRGSPLLLTMKNATVVTTPTGSVNTADIEAPLPFTVSIIERSDFGRNPKLAIFSAVDDDIEYYEARINNRQWHRVISPYPLPSRLFSYTLTIRAVDFDGNYRDQSIVVAGERRITGLLSSVLLVVILWVLYTHRKRK